MSDKRRRSSQVGVRFTPEEKAKLDAVAEAHDMTVPEYIRYMLKLSRRPKGTTRVAIMGHPYPSIGFLTKE